MIDGAVLAGYLAVAATRASGRTFEKGVDTLFDGLARRVEERLGCRAIARLQTEPGDATLRTRLGADIDAVARTDPQLARELAGLQHELDRKVGRRLIEVLAAPSQIDHAQISRARRG
jgi:hypothetical protein